MGEQRPMGYWLKTVDGLIDGKFLDALDEHGVTRRQWQLLNRLTVGPATAEELARTVTPFRAPNAPEDTVLDDLTELIESAWIDATPTGYEMTERGAAAHGRLEEVVADQRAILMAGISGADYATTVATLETMARNFGWTP